MRVVNVVDRTKPVIDLLGVNTVNLPRWKEYVDAPISLIDNYNSDAEMRANLIRINSLPKNVEGNHFGDGIGLFSVRYRVKDLSGNESEEVVRRINVMATSLGDVMNIEGFMSVYPNPSNGKVNLRLAAPQSETINVMVYDMLGKMVHQSQIQGGNLQANELDLSVQPKGFYLLKVQAGDKVFARKIQIN